jgi:hypothetical protein
MGDIMTVGLCVLSLLYVSTIALVASFAAVGLWFIAKVEALSLPVLVA